MTARRALLRGRLALRRLLRFGLRGPPGGFSLFGLLLHFLRQLLPGLEHLACQLLEAVAGAGAGAGLLAHAPAKVVELRTADALPFSLHDAGHDAHRIAGAEVGNLRVLLELNDRFQVHGNLAQFTVRPPEGQATPAPPRSAPPSPGGPDGAAPSEAGSAAAATW